MTDTPDLPLPRRAVLFDLDGVLADTAELHYRSWQALADELGIAFDRHANEAFRGLSRAACLARFLGDAADETAPEVKHLLLERKNDDFLRRVARMTPADALPGIVELLDALAAQGIARAVASSSRNAGTVIEQLGLTSRFATIVDGAAVENAKPEPDLFLEAARRLRLEPGACVVIEDAESGVAAARAAGMRVIGIGPRERVGRADRVVACTSELTAALCVELLEQQPT